MLAPTLPRPVTLAQMGPLIAERLETMRTEGGDPRVIRAIEHYPQRKEREAEAIASADRLARLAYLTAQPRPHVFLLRRTR
jgi:hypothetical protein